MRLEHEADEWQTGSSVPVAPSSILENPLRLSSLAETALLDSLPHHSFDLLTELAGRILGVPIVIISLVDGNRQFFVSEVGLSPGMKARETPLSHSFCQWVVAREEPLRVDDTASDALLCSNLAIRDMSVRAYCGVPLRHPNGAVLGAFAAIDTRTRAWSDDDLRLLEEFGALAAHEIELRLLSEESRRQAELARAAERQLAASEQRYRSVVDTLTEVVFQTDLKGNWLFLNAVWEQITGFSVSESLGKYYLDCVHAEDQQPTRDMLTALNAGESESCRQEIRFARKNGEYLWLELRARPTIDEIGNTVGTAGTLTDITDRYESIRQIADNEVRFRAVVECLGEGLIITDLDDRVTYVNARMAGMAGYPPQELMGRRAYDLLLSGSDREVMRTRGRAPTHGAFERYELRMSTKNGQTLWVEIHVSPLYEGDGIVCGTLSALSDITGRRAAEDQIARVTAELKRSNQSLQEFASVASHDLQEPLRKIQAFGDRLRVKCGDALTAEGVDYVERMQNAAGRMQTLINDLLLYSRVTSKAQPFQRVDLNKIARGVISDLETRLVQTGGSVVVDDLPCIAGDSLQLRQLFQNLIGNALKFHRPGEPPVVRVRFESEIFPVAAGRADEDSVGICRLYFEDNGIGFEPKFAERIFELFERLNSRAAYEGTGMGLAICRRIVERHSGTIQAESTLGAGTTFVVTLPAYCAKKSEINDDL